MKNLLFLLVMLLAVNFGVSAQSTGEKKKEEKAKKTQWVTKGAKVFNSKAEAKPLQVQAEKPVQTQIQTQPQVQRQAQPSQLQARTPTRRPTARIISPQQNREYEPRTPQNYNTYQPQVQTYNNDSYDGYQMEMKSMAVMESTEFMSQGTNNALVVEIEGADAKTAKKVWATFMKENYSTRVTKVKKEDDYIAEGVNIGIVGSGGGVNLYSRAEDRGRSAKFMVWMDVGNDFLSSASYPSWYGTAENMMYEYKLEVKRELVREELKDEEKNLQKLQANLKKLKRDQDRYHKAIEEAYKRIQRAEADIAKNDADQQGSVQEIEQQMIVIQQIMNKLNSIQ